MEKKDKKILIITSGVFLIVLAFILFFTMQSKDNMMSNAGRYKGTEARLGDSSTIDNCAEDYWTCPSDSTAISGGCYKNLGNTAPLESSECSAAGGLVVDGVCHISANEVDKIWKCRTCKTGYEPDASGDSCVKTTNSAVLTCDTTVTWTGEQQQLAYCQNCGFEINGTYTQTLYTGTNVGQYDIVAQADTGYTFASNGLERDGCTVYITCPNDMSPDGKGGCTSSVTCVAGKYLPGQSNQCQSCPAGYSCPGGTYAIGDSSPSGLTQCTGNTYASGGASTCSNCSGSIQKSGSLNVGCTATTGCDPGKYQIKQSDGSFECESCPNGYIATTDIPYCHVVISAGSYLVGGTSEIRTCPANTYSAGGVYIDGTGCMSGGDCTIDSCHACPNNTTSPMGSTSSSACVSATGTCTITTSTNASRVSYGDSFNVSVSVSGDGCNGRTMTVSATRGTTTSNSYNISNGQSFNFTVTASEQTTCTSSVIFTATAGDASDSVSVDTIRDWYLEKIDACVTDSDYNSTSHSLTEADAKPEDVYYIVKGDNTCGSGNKKVDVYRRGCGSTPTPPSPTTYCCRLEADDGNYYQTDQTSCASSWQIYTGTCSETPACYLRTSDNKYVSGNYKDRAWYTQVDASKCASTPVVEEKACYVKYGNGTNNQYCYNTATVCAGYTKVNRSEALCNETPACYLNKNDGKYYTGSFQNQSNYTYYGTTCPKEACYIKPDGTYEWTDSPVYGSRLVPSITKEADCVAPTPVVVTTYACYVNTSRTDYKWYTECNSGEYFDGTSCKTGTNTSTDPNKIYSKDSTINNATSCIPPQTPGCYINLSNGNYVWGLYDNVVGYNKVTSITSQSMCVNPKPACYVDSVGNYVWGIHENDSNYTLIKSITKQSACTKTIPVPKTDLNVSTIIYISIAILSVFGVGFISYANRKKKLYK